jgi:hypothetical protein
MGRPGSVEAGVVAGGMVADSFGVQDITDRQIKGRMSSQFLDFIMPPKINQ